MGAKSIVTPQSKTGTFAAAFQYTEKHAPLAFQGLSRLEDEKQLDRRQASGFLPQRRTLSQAIGLNGYNATPDPPPPLYVRALYTYDADDQTSLSFRQGDIIQVLTQLDSGWWDGVINDVRGWFPSNYCEVVSGPDHLGHLTSTGQDESDASASSGIEDDEYDEPDQEVDTDGNPWDEDSDAPVEASGDQTQEEAAFWIPQATSDGRLFYFNTLTGVSRTELPLETPTSGETGPQDRTNFHVPDQTRPPPEMMARGFETDAEDYEDSASEADLDSSMLSFQSSRRRQRRSRLPAGASKAISMDSIHTSPSRNNLKNILQNNSSSHAVQQPSSTLESLGTTATSPAINALGNMTRSGIPRYFLDDGSTNPTSWNDLVGNMRHAIDAYKEAVKTRERALFVRRAEDISDHLRMLLAAGSGTTDNHFGNPSIISTNKALYPHFRDMMSRFSKLVLSSHIAATDWPGPDALAKCLQEAGGVLHGVYGYVEVARQQRGEEIPRLVPGFVSGTNSGGNWHNNNVSTLEDSSQVTSFISGGDSDSQAQPSTALDSQMLSRVNQARKVLHTSLRRLEEGLQLDDKIINPAGHATLGNTICSAAENVIASYRPWVALVESINLAPLGSAFQHPQLLDFSSQKQKVYDDIADLVASCQTVTAPLADEWAEVRGPSLEDRLKVVRTDARQLDSSVSQIDYSLQLFSDTMPAMRT